MQQPSFDTWTSIFLFAAVQGIFVSAVLWFIQKGNRFTNRLLSLLLFLFSVTLIEYVLYWTKYQVKFPHSLDASGSFPFLYGIILLFYFRNVFEQKKIAKKDIYHLLPFFIYVLSELPLYLSTAETKVKWMHADYVAPSLFH